MGFFSDVVSNPLSVVANPLSSLTTKFLSGGSKGGPPNPYSKPDLAYLADTSKLDYLKNPGAFNFLKDAKQFDFLKQPTAPNKYGANLPNNYKTVASNYNAPGREGSQAIFDQLLGTIGKPSSVDQVRSQVEGQQLQDLLDSINTDTKNSVGSLKSDFADRGLGGPGMISDIEGNALAQAYATGDKTRAGARGEFLNKQLDRAKTQELSDQTARQNAYNTRYGSEVNAENQNIANSLDVAKSDVGSYNQMLDELFKGQITAGEGNADRNSRNMLSYADILRSGNQSYADKLSGGNDLFAQLLNARDLGAAGINSTNYNTGVDAQYKYEKPSFLDSFIRNSGITLGG